jgi:hypothetical protein
VSKHKRVSKIDRLAEGVAQDYAHASTEDITRERAVWNFTLSAVEAEIVALQARMASARSRRAKVESRLRGLALVVGKR